MKRKTCIFKNVVMLFMAIGLFTVFIGCKDKNDEVGPLRQEVQALRADLTKEFDSKVAAKTAELQKQLDETKAKVDKMSTTSGVTEKQLNDAKQEVINATVTKVAFEDYVKSVKSKIENAATASDLNALKSDLGKVESRVSALETLVGSNKAALDKALSALDAKYKTQVDALQASINANKSSLTDLLNQYKAAKGSYASLNERLAAIEKKMGTSVVSGILNSRLTSLVLIPEYVSDQGGALPVVLFAPLETQKCGFISPDVVVKYAVSPSTVTAADIDVNNLKFMYNDPKTLKKAVTDDNLKAKFVSLTNGVLTVKVVGDLLNETWAVSKTNPEKRIDQLMLQVPLATGNAVVSSDWAKIQYGAKTAEIVRAPANASTGGKYTSAYVLKPTVQEAKNLPLTNITVVDMAWDQQLDLNTVVESVYSDWNVFNPSIYDLAFSFDLKDEKGNAIDYKTGPQNKTDQQEFINIAGSVASTKVYGKNANRAAIGRTPLVHVMLKSKDGCLVKEGFIKLNIVEKAIVPVPPVTYNGSHLATCKSVQELLRIGTKTMNEDFYHKANMSKEDFHKNYTFKALALNPADSTNVGTIAQIKDPNDTDSYNLVYTLTEPEVWNNIGKTVWAEATYTYGTGPRASVIKVKFAVKITKETVNLDLLIGNYWYQDSSSKKSQTTGVYNTVIHNVAVPANKSTDSNLATFDNNINNAFVVVDKQTNNTLNLNNAVTPANKYDNYSYEYIFDVTANQPVKTVTGHKDGTINISVSANGKNLIAKQGSKTQVIATIKAQSTTDGDVLSYNENSELGKYLLNKEPEFMRARVVLVVKNECGKRVNVVVKNLQDKDRFYVNFLRPINVQTVSGEYFVDAVDFGKPFTYIDMKKVAELSDWRKRVKGTDKYDFLPNNENYYQYYDVQDIKVTGKIKAKGLTIGGKDVEDILKETNVKIDQTPNGEVFNGKTYTYGRLTYDNNGNNLGKNFTLIVPVTITYKWGKVEKVVEVEVKATSTSARQRVK